jgi:membrane protease YdiL (CAAX protease family)
MELENPTAPAPASASTLRSVFFNERGLRAGWRLVIFAAILAALWFVSVSAFSLLSTAMGAPQGQAAAGSPLWLSLAEMAYFIPVLLATWIMSKIERQRVGTYGLPLAKSALPRFAVGYVAWGFVPLTVVLLTMRLLGVFYFGGLSVHGRDAFYWAAAWGLMFLSVALLEEYLFRGYALYTLADGVGFWPATVILAVAFARVHMGNGGESRIGIAGVLLFAIFASATLRRTGNLWLAVGAHAGWDWGESFFYGVSDSGFQAPGHLFNPRVQGPDWLSGGSVGPEGSIVTLIFWALMTVGFLLFYRPRRGPSVIGTAGEGLSGVGSL